MLTCNQARLLLYYGAVPGSSRRGFPELGFHLALCTECQLLWEASCRSSKIPYSPRTYSSQVDDRPISQQLSIQDVALLASLLDEVDAVQISPSPNIPSSIPNRVPQEMQERQGFGVVGVSSCEAVTYQSLLQNANFRLLWLSQAISTFGSYFTRIAVPLYVFALTQSYVHLGLAFFSSLVASLLFGLLAGALVDRWDRRRAMFYTDVCSGFVLLTLVVCAWLPLAVPVKLSSIYVVTFVAALLREIYKIARVSIFTEVVSEEQLLVANSLDGATTTLAEFLSYPLAAVALSFIGPTAAFGVDAVTFLVSALLIRQVAVQPVVTKHNDVKKIWIEIKEGLMIAASLTVVRKIVLLSFVVPLLFSLHNTLLIPYAEEALDSTKEIGFPALVAADALGLLVGMLALGRFGQRLSRMMLLALGIFGYGLGTFAQGILPQIAPFVSSASRAQAAWTPLLFIALLFALVCGAANSLILATLRTVLQEHSPRAALGRVYSVMSVAAGAGFALGALLTGFGQGSAAMIMTAVGGALLLLGLLCYWWLPEKRAKNLLPTTNS